MNKTNAQMPKYSIVARISSHIRACGYGTRLLYPVKRLRNEDNVAEVDKVQHVCIILVVIYILIAIELPALLLKEILVQYCDYYYCRQVYLCC